MLREKGMIKELKRGLHPNLEQYLNVEPTTTETFINEDKSERLQLDHTNKVFWYKAKRVQNQKLLESSAHGKFEVDPLGFITLSNTRLLGCEIMILMLIL